MKRKKYAPCEEPRKGGLEGCAVDRLFFFLIGLGIGEAVRHLRTYITSTPWQLLMLRLFQVGVVGYVFWMGAKQLTEAKKIEEQARENGAVGGRVNPQIYVEAIMYWVVAAIITVITF